MSDKKQTILVCGLGRCGSSLTMQMLSSAGLKCAGDFPAFEPDFTKNLIIPLSQCSQYNAVKILDPHRRTFSGTGNIKAIWLDRNPKEQAKSQIKLIASTGLTVEVSRASRMALVRSLVNERTQALSTLRKWPVLKVSFEELISDIEGQRVFAAKSLADFCELPDSCIDEMCDCIITRSTNARPDMSIEIGLIKAGEIARKYKVPISMAVERLGVV